MKKPSICFLIPYFGRWPFWMPFFLESCRRNPDIDWLFFTDCGPLEGLPENVRVHTIRYEDYLSQVSKKLGTDFYPPDPYKLCDLKPAYGFIHEEALSAYDFWAFGDIDLVYGRLREYFTEERLCRYDLISTHERRVSGHLCLIRNTPRMCNAFKLIPRWQERLLGPHQALDEGAFTRIFLWRKNFPKPLFKFVGLFNPWCRKSEFRETYSTPNARLNWIDGSKNFPLRWFWQDGRLTNDKDRDLEFPYLHFVAWKKNEWAAQAEPSPDAVRQLVQQPRWQISARGFEGIA